MLAAKSRPAQARYSILITAMRVITPHMLEHRPKRRRPGVAALKIGGGLLAAAIVVNFALFGWFYNRTYPRTTLGLARVGNTSFAAVEQAAAAHKGVPSTLTFTDGVAHVQLPFASVATTADASRTHTSLRHNRSWLALVAVLRRHTIAVPYMVQAKQLSQNAQLASTFHQTPTDASVTLKSGTFTAAASKDGHDLDSGTLPGVLQAALDRGQQTVHVPTITIPAHVTLTQAKRQASQLQASLQTSIAYTYGTSQQTPSITDIASWYAPSGSTYAIDDFALRTYIAAAGVKMGVHSSNLTAAVTQTKQALASHTAMSLALVPFAQTKTYHYCVATRGTVSATEVSALKDSVAAIYADLRGWSLDGQVQFVYADSGCDFTIWLATADQMSSFDPICDDYWNCEASGNVVVNLDRWQQATPSWNQAEGTSKLNEYRAMLINHETGHMLGFGHTTCPATGQPAPVMMQESINLQGCVFNAWPVQSELDALRARLDL